MACITLGKHRRRGLPYKVGDALEESSNWVRSPVNDVRRGGGGEEGESGDSGWYCRLGPQPHQRSPSSSLPTAPVPLSALPLQGKVAFMYVMNRIYCQSRMFRGTSRAENWACDMEELVFHRTFLWRVMPIQNCHTSKFAIA